MSLNHPYANTTATEAWPPNVHLCRQRLAPLGIRVHQVFKDNFLPFENNCFDIVINRHAAFSLSEVSRVLKPGGLFITQQVGCHNNSALLDRFDPRHIPSYPDWTLKNVVSEFKALGFDVLYQNEAFPESRFYDVGAIVYVAKNIPWEFKDFSVDRHYPALCALQKDIEATGVVSCHEHRFIVAGQKNKV